MASDHPSSKICDAKPQLPMDPKQQLGTVLTSLPTASTGHTAWEKPGSESRRGQEEV